MKDVEARLVDLELRFMKLERFAEELSQVVAAQGLRIEALVVETKRLRGLLDAGEEGEEAGEQRPPHY